MIAIYPGTFDPITHGHVDIVQRAAKLFTRVLIAVAESAGKKPHLSCQERVTLCKTVFEDNPAVHVESFAGLLVDYLKHKNSFLILRGLRSAADLDVEFQLAAMNQTLLPECETMWMKAQDSTSTISSTIVREIAAMGGDVSLFVPPVVAERLREK